MQIAIFVFNGLILGILSFFIVSAILLLADGIPISELPKAMKDMLS